MSFKLHTVLSSMMKSHSVPLHAARDVNHPIVPNAHAVCAPRLVVTQ